jgi:hypothetical protein
MIKTTRTIILVWITLFGGLGPAARGQSSLNLPTPRDHYKSYSVERAETELMGKLIKDFGPQISKFVEFMDHKTKTENLPPTESEELLNRGGDAGLESLVKVWNDFDPNIRERVVEFLRAGAAVGNPQRRLCLMGSSSQTE